MVSYFKNSFLFDKFAVSTSALCAVHCLFLPIALSLFPALGSTIFGQESFHKWLLFLVIPFSLVALTMGCKQHKSWLVVLLGITGLGILIFTAAFGHDLFGHEGEQTATLIGVSILALSHLDNYKLCRRTNCAT
ncbi:MAG: MerC domain-containing protein [Gammaproteobacteria bacterium]